MARPFLGGLSGAGVAFLLLAGALVLASLLVQSIWIKQSLTLQVEGCTRLPAADEPVWHEFELVSIISARDTGITSIQLTWTGAGWRVPDPPLARDLGIGCTPVKIESSTEPLTGAIGYWISPFVMLFWILIVPAHRIWFLGQLTATPRWRLALWPSVLWIAALTASFGIAMENPNWARPVQHLENTPLTAIPVIVLFAPIAEEAWFRGVIQEKVASFGRPLIAVIFSAYLFAVLHFLMAPAQTSLLRFMSLLAVGLCFAWASWRSGSVLPAMALHVLNNVIGLGTARFSS